MQLQRRMLSSLLLTSAYTNRQTGAEIRGKEGLAGESGDADKKDRWTANLVLRLLNNFFPQDGYLEGELLDGRKGLVPSNLIERLAGEDLLEFHQSCVVGIQEEDIWSTMVPSNLPVDYGPDETSSPQEEPMPYQCKKQPMKLVEGHNILV